MKDLNEIKDIMMKDYLDNLHESKDWADKWLASQDEVENRLMKRHFNDALCIIRAMKHCGFISEMEWADMLDKAYNYVYVED